MAVPMKTRLRVLRAEKEWSQAELAAHVGVARGTINAIETGKYDPSLPLAFKIARVFGKTVEEVFLYQESELSAVTNVSL
jgi:putative transcriptional regulator